MDTILRRLMFATLALCFCYSAIVSADNHTAKQAPSEQGQSLSKTQAAQLAQQKMGGKILKIQRSHKQGRSGYSIKLLQDSGHVRQVWVDGNSGKIF